MSVHTKKKVNIRASKVSRASSAKKVDTLSIGHESYKSVHSNKSLTKSNFSLFGETEHTTTNYGTEEQSKVSESAHSSSSLNSDCIESIFNVKEISNRKYIDATLGPILLFGLYELDLQRPPDPISYLACFLLKNKDRAFTIDEPESDHLASSETEGESEEYDNVTVSVDGTTSQSHAMSQLTLSSSKYKN